MYYPGPDRYQVYDRRTAQRGFYEESRSFGYGASYGPYQPSPPPPSFHGYYGAHHPAIDPYRGRVVESVDQGEELLDRLEQSGRVPSKDKFRRMACMVRELFSDECKTPCNAGHFSILQTFVSTGVCPYGDRCKSLPP
jgi:hypothetical protein